MLINLCENYLDTTVNCDKPSTDGYEVKNLLTNNSSGFLAYSTIKPPINIDFDFICKIKLSHVIIWPCVGSQKSTGFKLYTKFNHQQEHNLLSSGFLDTNHTGCLFASKYMNGNNSRPILRNFLNATINNYHKNTVDYLDNLRITIVKTDKSVPAIKGIEIWAWISPFSDQLNNSNRIFDLLLKHNNCPPEITAPIKSCNDEETITSSSTESCGSLAIPEEYLDPITWTLMLQPIILPSGKIIDQSTLESYGENEAQWGRPLSDPYTGITLNDNYKPMFALQLKLKIDKYLSENADNSEIKQLPRMLGHRNHFNVSYYTRNGQEFSNVKNYQRKMIGASSGMSKNGMNNSQKNTIHKLPIISRQRSRTINTNYVNKLSRSVSTITSTTVSKVDSDDTLRINCEIDDKLKSNLQNVLANLKRFNDIKVDDKNTIIGKHICDCCEHPIFYKLPCSHIICRKIILSYNSNNNNNDNKSNNKNLQCPKCTCSYQSSEMIRFHN